MTNNARNPTEPVKMNVLDRAISFFSPKWAYERACYRAGMGYKAAEQSMSRANWTPINGTGESINQMSRPLMRARARDAERNSDITNGILLAYRRNVVGKGFTLQATSFDEGFNLEAEKVWRRWCKAKNCDITGKQSLREILNMLVERTIVDGGLILVKTVVKGERYPFKLQLREVDDLDTSGFNAPKNGNVVVGGVELDSNGKPVAYYFKKTAPDGYTNYEVERVPAERVIFYWERKRPTEYREVPRLARSLARIKDMDDYLETASFARKIAASLALVITQKFPDGMASGIGRQFEKLTEKLLAPQDADTKVQGFSGGDVLYLQPGQEPHNVVPAGSANDTKDYLNMQARMTAAGQGLSLESANRDVSEVNYSSARQNLLEDKKIYLDMQMSIIEHVLEPLYEEVIKTAYLTGEIKKRNDFYNRLEDYLECSFLPQGIPGIDPLKEANAKKIMLECGLATYKTLYAEEGKDWREEGKQRALEKAYFEEIGLETTKKGEGTNGEPKADKGTGSNGTKNESGNAD